MLHSKIKQDTLNRAGSEPYSFVDDDSDFEQRVHTLSAGVNLRILENLNCRIEGYHIRSSAEFTPGISEDDAPLPSIANPDELKDISEVDIRQNGIKSRITWQFTRMFEPIQYTYDDYDDQNSDVFRRFGTDLYRQPRRQLLRGGLVWADLNYNSSAREAR